MLPVLIFFFSHESSKYSFLQLFSYPLFACHLRQLYSTTDCVVVDEELKKALWDPSRQKALVSGRFADAGERLQESVWGQ